MFNDGFQYGSLSMRSAAWGMPGWKLGVLRFICGPFMYGSDMVGPVIWGALMLPGVKFSPSEPMPTCGI